MHLWCMFMCVWCTSTYACACRSRTLTPTGCPSTLHTGCVMGRWRDGRQLRDWPCALENIEKVANANRSHYWLSHDIKMPLGGTRSQELSHGRTLSVNSSRVPRFPQSISAGVCVSLDLIVSSVSFPGRPPQVSDGHYELILGFLLLTVCSFTFACSVLNKLTH